MRVLGSIFQLAFDAGARIQQLRRFAARCAAAKMRLRGYFSKTGSRHAQIEDAGMGIGLGQQPLRRIYVLPPDGEHGSDSQRCGQACSSPEVQPRRPLLRLAMWSAGKFYGQLLLPLAGTRSLIANPSGLFR